MNLSLCGTGTFASSDGPLTYIQLEHNLPRQAHSIPAGSAWTASTLQDILDVLVETDVVQVVEESESGSSPNTTDGTPPLRYSILGGAPRSDVILPSQVVSEIEFAHGQWKRSLERTEALRRLLLEKTLPAKEVLQSLVRKYPEVVEDPVYVAALRNLNIDLAATAKEREAEKGR